MRKLTVRSFLLALMLLLCVIECEGLATNKALLHTSRKLPFSTRWPRSTHLITTHRLVDVTSRISTSLREANGSDVPIPAKGLGESDPLSSVEPMDPFLTELVVSTDDELDEADLRFRSTMFSLFQAAIVGSTTGLAVSIFKLSIEAVREIVFSQELLVPFPELLAFLPSLGGLMVGGLLLLGNFKPGLRGTVVEVDKDSDVPPRSFKQRVQSQLNSLRKTAASVFTLGTGNSLGPEGPCVELGMSVSRSFMDISEPLLSSRKNWNRLLLSCGASAGVAAGFNAPIAGVFFALEVMQNTFVDIDPKKNDTDELASGGLSSSSTIVPVLMASVLSALVSKSILGEHLILKLSTYSLKDPLVELPLYLLLGALSGFVAFAFSQTAKFSQSFFDGKVGSENIRDTMKSIPKGLKPAVGGLICGIIGLQFPQILFFGYETLNALLANNALPTTLLLTLLLVKTLSTAISAGSGLVGGTFAPSLFLGAMTGASFHNIACNVVDFLAGHPGFTALLSFTSGGLADVAAYAMVGAASVLAALFRAPLTASLLLFELTLDYKVILPLMVSAGVGSVVGDVLDAKLETFKEKLQTKRRDKDSVSWGDLSSREE